MYHFVICENNANQADLIRSQIASIIKDCCIQIYLGAEDLLKDIANVPKRTIFLINIDLVDHSGIDVAIELQQKVNYPIIIFIGDDLNKISDIYDVCHCYFIYKPQLLQRLPMALQKAMFALQKTNKKLSLHLKDRIVLLAINDIHCLERKKRTTYIYCQDVVYKCSYDFQYFFEQLPETFVLCHRSFMVNLNKVKEFKRVEFILDNELSVPISRNYVQEMKRNFQKLILNKI